MAKTISQLAVELTLNSAKFTSETEKARKSIDGFRGAISLIKWDSIVTLGEKAFRTGQQIFQMAEMGAKVKSIEDSFKLMARNSGVAIDNLISNLKKATNETIDESDLMGKATRLISEGFSADQITVIGSAARTAARLMGTDVSTAYEQIADAIVNLRERGLKTAGFIIDIDEAETKHAKTLGITRNELNDYGKQIAWTNALKEKDLELQKKLNIEGETSYENMQKQKSTWKDIYEELAKVVSMGWEFLSQQAMIAKGMGSSIDWAENITETDKERVKVYNELIEVQKKFYAEEEHGMAMRRGAPLKSQIKTVGEDEWWKKFLERNKVYFEQLQRIADAEAKMVSEEEAIRPFIKDEWVANAQALKEALQSSIPIYEVVKEDWGAMGNELVETADAYGITVQELREIRENLQAGVKDNEHFIDSLKEVSPIFQEIGSLLSSNMVTLMSTTEKWSEKFKKMGESILQTLAQIALKMALIEAFKGLMPENKNSYWGTIVGGIVKGLGGSLQTGTPYVPETGLYQLHQGEAVIPAGQQGSGNIYNITYIGPIEATDIDSFERKYGGSVNKIFKQSARKGGLARKSMRSYI
jgi:hypothetical protein